MEVIICGAINYDILHYPTKDVKCVGGGLIHQLSVIKKAFPEVKVDVLGIIGKNFKETSLFQGFEVSGLQKADHENSFFEIYYDEKGNETYGNRSTDLYDLFEPKIPESYKQAQGMCFSGIKPYKYLEMHEQFKGLKLYNTCPPEVIKHPEESAEAINQSDIAILNEIEYKELKQKLNYKNKVLVTQGEKPTIIINHGKIITEVPTIKVEGEKYFVGAGDSFKTGLMIKYLETKNLVKSTAFGHAVASTYINTNGLDLDHEKIEKRYEKLLTQL